MSQVHPALAAPELGWTGEIQHLLHGHSGSHLRHDHSKLLSLPEELRTGGHETQC
jgi:hypothetical protein